MVNDEKDASMVMHVDTYTVSLDPTEVANFFPDVVRLDVEVGKDMEFDIVLPYLQPKALHLCVIKLIVLGAVPNPRCFKTSAALAHAPTPHQPICGKV